MNRPANRLQREFLNDRKKLVIYLTCGDPSLDRSREIVLAAAAAGADVVELGVPFSDPSADGPAIQRAMGRALRQGGGLRATLELSREVRTAGCEVPLLLFGYYNPMFVYGVERFVAACADAGLDGLLAVDLPVDEVEELLVPAKEQGLSVVPLVAPTSTPQRISRVAALKPPFVYYVSMTGTTGSTLRGPGEIRERVEAVRKATGVPVAVGFGITNPGDAGQVSAFADAIVVGSAVVRVVEENPGREAMAVGQLVASLKGALG